MEQNKPEGLEFKKFKEIKNFNKLLQIFLNSLDIELNTWTEYKI